MAWHLRSLQILTTEIAGNNYASACPGVTESFFIEKKR